MELKNISNAELCLRMEKLIRSERKITHLILIHILEFESRKLYAELGFDSLFSYLTKKMGYCESSAYRRIQAARLLKQVPQVAEKLEDGSLNLSQLTRVQKCLREEAKKGQSQPLEKTQNILKQIVHCNSFETQKVLAREFDLSVQTHALTTPQKDDSIRLEITLSKEQFAELKVAKNQLSHICHEGSWAEVIAALASKFNKVKMGKDLSKNHSAVVVTQGFCLEAVGTTNDASFSKVEKSLEVSSLQEEEISKTKRSYISIKIKRALLEKAQHRCEFQSVKGLRCESTYKLQIDHRQPLALGGSNACDNLRILCHTHNQLEARRHGLLR